MAVFHSNLFADAPLGTTPESSFWLDGELAGFGYDPAADQALAVLSVKVHRKPHDLAAHLRRIHSCYRNRHSAALYAALLDLSIALQGKGEALRRRILNASRLRLEPRDFQVLSALDRHDPKKLGNRYSILASGIQGSSALLAPRQAQAETSHDPLALANDFIEYSQLDQAIDVLENAVGLQPQRADLQLALLELYRSTASHERFRNAWRTFSDLAVPLVGEWQSVADYFDRQLP
ncbi:FimV family protein [Methylomonas sp. DH-1]|uniref:type IV pilus assembly protein FimV n=1 Tax=Methylomonas sp. (strain DH-1) TaxID=1727196 RepID=UPI0007C8D6FF|nr:hypothetical protein [Methylomonas sp. DH-1]ANE55744.1 hypothetical protein AYM39_11500 [Methylomonas sp. DH-1]